MANLWSGRFDEEPDADVFSFGVSLHVDRRLFEDDVTGSLAWADALAEAGVLSRADHEAIRRGLTEILDEGRRNPGFVAGDDEDIHSFVERQLVERVGEPGKRLHTGRSRNEQVSLDLRLYLKRRIPHACASLRALIAALLAQAGRSGLQLMPSYTHTRRAQPVLVAHYLLSHVAALRRDHRHLEQAADDADEMPLGSGAIAGTSYAIDTAALARRLGFARVVANSLDAASDRDFVSTFLHASALTLVHLSRLAEDLILYSGEEFGFFELPDRLATGSSLMPQKKNPDPLELVRGKCGRLIGHLTGWLATMKGLPGGYNRDLQEDKEPVFDAESTLVRSLDVMAAVVAGIRLDERRAAAAADGLLVATDVADYLVARGMPFREAHGVVGAVVRRLLAEGRGFSDLTLGEWQSHSELFGPDIVGAITPASSVSARQTPQSTAPSAVASALEDAKSWLERSGPAAAGIRQQPRANP
jgi:argininosuccinate lyase